MATAGVSEDKRVPVTVLTDIAWSTGTTRLFGACEDGRVVAFNVGLTDQ